jgi:polysaccharide export outer membrane protein
MEELLSANPKLNVAIEEGDILYVPRNGVAKVGFVVQTVNPFGYLLLIKAFAFP